MKKTKKRILSAITSVLLVSTMLACTMMTASASSDAWTVNGTLDLTYVSSYYRGNAYGIQTILYRLGYLTSSGVDSYFGPKTKDAVIKYQKAKGLTQDGKVGNDTWSKFYGELTETTYRNILRNKDNADIGVFSTYKVTNGSKTTDCFFSDLCLDTRSHYYDSWLTDNGYSGRGTTGSFTLSSNAWKMNTDKKVDSYS